MTTLPPHSDEAERGILGCILLQPDLAHDHPLPPEIFYSLPNRAIYQALQRADTPIDLITVGEILKTSGQFEQIGGISYLTDLIDGVPSAANFQYYADIAREKLQARKLIQLSHSTIEIAPTSPEQALYNLELGVTTLRDDGKSDGLNSKQVARSFIDRLQDRMARQGELSGFPTGLRRLDSMTDGFQRGELSIVAARPSIGKTAYAGTVALANLGTPTLFVTVEMSAESIARRLISSIGNVSLMSLTKGLLSESDLRSVTTATATLSNSPIRWLDFSGGATITQIISAMRREVRKHDIKLVIVDYLQKVKPSRIQATRTYEVEEISNAFKEFARSTQSATLVLAQLNREHEKANKPRKPVLSDLADSSSIEKDGDLIIFLDRKREESEGKAKLIVAKARNGECGEVESWYVGRHCRFEEPKVEIDHEHNRWD